MNVWYSFILSHEAQHLIFKRLGPSLDLVLISLAAFLLLLPLETLWSILMLIVLPWSMTTLYSTYIGKIFMVSQYRCVVGWKVVVGLEILASISTHKLSLLRLIGPLFNKVPHQSCIYALFFPLFPLRLLNGFSFLEYSFYSSVHPAWPR